MITLYYNPQSRAGLTRWLLEELAVPYELKSVAYDDGSMRAPEFLALNPMGKIPTIVDDGVAVTEQVAIAIYLADKYKSPYELAPDPIAPQRAEYLRWLVFAVSCVEPAMTQKAAGFDMDRRQAGWASNADVSQVLTKRLGGPEPWILGDWFTAADVVLAGTLRWAVEFSLLMGTDEIRAYVERAAARPAFKKAILEPMSA